MTITEVLRQEPDARVQISRQGHYHAGTREAEITVSISLPGGYFGEGRHVQLGRAVALAFERAEQAQSEGT